MQKNNNLILISFVLLLYSFLPLHGSAQPTSGHFRQKVIYKRTYHPDSTNAQKISEEYMQLYLGDTISLFQSVNGGLIDSAVTAENKKGNLMGPSTAFLIPLIKSGMKRYNIFKTNEAVTTYDRIGPDNYYYYIEMKDLFKWNIQQDTMRIGNFLCQKALTNFGGRTWVAWFTQEIPVAEGPYKFCDLPGLILQISDLKNYWSFNFMSITNTDTVIKPVFANIPKFKASKQAFFKDLDYYKNNGIEIESAGGFLQKLTPEQREKAIAREKVKAKQDNNWIELYDPNSK